MPNSAWCLFSADGVGSSAASERAMARPQADPLKCSAVGAKEMPRLHEAPAVAEIISVCLSNEIHVILLSAMKTCHPFVVFFLGSFFLFCLSSYAGTFSGKVSDLDAGDGYLTVTNPDDQTTQTFKVTSATVIVTSDGKPSQLLDLIEGTRVAVDADPGSGEVAAKITVLPDVSSEPP